ncbi:MAG: carboxymuconolactone decarboxylase family protein [Deltaproteobacteria bacterium]|nr:carboxymuconolactone decarboxylase family protein [Deltaproteobacteria bacterium]
MNPQQSYGRQAMGDEAVKLAQLTDDVLFNDVWERPELSKRDRSLITVSALVALYRLEQLPGHLARALENGVRRDELIETITHLAFYAGWPSAHSSIRLLNAIPRQR